MTARTSRKHATSASSVPTASTAGGHGVGEVRIVGGQWKRTRLSVPVRPGLRPTPDRVRETLFNWLGQDLQGWVCWDAFAGTGALGLEAASRGATQVVLIEQDRVLVQNLRSVVQRLQASAVQVVQGDGIAQMQRCQPAPDLIFLDPPFGQALVFETALKAAVAALKPQGWIYLEAPSAWGEAELNTYQLKVHRHLKAGAVHAHLLCKI